MTDELLEKVITVIENSSPSHVGYRGLRMQVLSELRQEQGKRSNPLQTWEDLARATPDVVFVPACTDVDNAMYDCIAVMDEKARRERDGLPPLTMVYIGERRITAIHNLIATHTGIDLQQRNTLAGIDLQQRNTLAGVHVQVLWKHPDYFGFEKPNDAT